MNLVGDPAHGQLAESRFVPRTFLPGGEHNMYEIAFAAAALGHEVELRGWLFRPAFDLLRAGSGAAPRTGLPARIRTSEDLVIVPEGWENAPDYGQLLSGARLAIFLLAPPGLFGWPFADTGWKRPDPLTVPLVAVGRPENFAAMRDSGFYLADPLARTSTRGGGGRRAVCVRRRRRRPHAAPPGPVTERTVDAVGLTFNRRAPLVHEVAAQLDGCSLELVGESPNE